MTEVDVVEQVDQDDLDDNLIERVVPVRPRKVALQKSLRPWHKPRKQAARRAWKYHIRKLMRRLHFPAGNPRLFRYLTLAGPDMLDIRNLEDVIKEGEFQLKWNGFSPRNCREEAEIILNQSQLRDYDWIDNGSEVLWYRLEEIASGANSVALREALSHGPFHAINFDLCQNITARSGQSPSVLSSLLKLIDFQALHCTHDWLIFITTKVERLNTPAENIRDFLDSINNNIDVSPDFAEAFDALCLEQGIPSQVALTDPLLLSNDAFVKFFCLGLTKWLLRHLCTAVPRIELTMENSHLYSVEPGVKDMLSLVYRCSPVRRAPAAVDAMDDLAEVRLGQIAVLRTRELRDLDDVQDPGLLAETQELLRLANYPAELIAELR